MRTIKCRGYCTETQSWVIGSLITYKNGETYIVEHEDEEVSFKVIPETVGQFIGLWDTDNTEMFEDDIIRDIYGDVIGVIKCRYDRYIICTKYPIDENTFNPNTDSKDMGKSEDWKIIGNIHDNPELIKKT